MRKAIGAGIGLFIALIGLKSGGIVVGSEATLVDLGTLTSGPGLLSVIGLIITGILVILNIPGALLIGIIATALIGIPMGITKLSGFVSAPPSIAPIFCKFDFSQVFSLDMLVVVFTFLFVDMFDTIGTLVGVTTKADMVDEKGKPVRLNQAFLADAIGTMAGAALGTSTVTTYVESATGVAEGGRTGLSAFVIAMCFVVSLFLAPLFLAIPAAATAPVMVMAGFYLFSSVRHISLTRSAETMSSFLAILLMPVTGSISDGIVLGLCTYIILTFIEEIAFRLKRN
jgi:AGZA family xanthine/uracil permease-like MFS transporter